MGDVLIATNASVNSLPNSMKACQTVWQAFMLLWGHRLFIRPVCTYSFHTVRAAQPKTS